MVGFLSALEGLHVTWKYRDRSMQHTCSRHAAWDPHMAWYQRGRRLPLPAERICIERMTSDRKRKASTEGSK